MNNTWNRQNFSNPGRLQHADGVVKSVMDCRQAYSSMNDQKFAAWYEQHQRVPERRTLAILAVHRPWNGGDAS